MKIGTLIIPKRKVNVKLYEKLFSEIICINIEIKDEFVENNSRKESFFELFSMHDWYNVEKFYNPIEEYKGFVVYSSYKRDLDPERLGGTERTKFNILWNGDGLSREKETFIIELEKEGERSGSGLD